VRALVTGAAGQLGIELLKTAPHDFDVTGLAREQCDITDPAAVSHAVANHRADVVINAAAYTAVDDAESRRELAHAVNATGAGNIARAAESVGARTIHISTDYVFDGASRKPYSPDAPTNPINAYGSSKLAGEKEVSLSCSNFLIIRSGWLYASHGKNFLRTILRLLQASRPLRVVDDQIGVPTSARELAAAIWACAVRPELRGTYHWVEDGTGSWYDFAMAIQRNAADQGLVSKATTVVPIKSEEWQSPARRPRYSVLDASSLWSVLGTQPHVWHNSLAEIVGELASASS
jgi:dTDP-4-dehydrorhamnose reductase